MIDGITSFGSEMVSVPVVHFNYAFNAKTADRLKNLELLRGASAIMNLATADPSALSKGTPHVVLSSDGQPAFFFLVGTATNSSLFSGLVSRQISVAFSGHTWPRALAVLGRVHNVDVLWLQSFKSGVTLSTYRRKKGVWKSTDSKSRY